jgi:hypothetical protein
MPTRFSLSRPRTRPGKALTCTNAPTHAHQDRLPAELRAEAGELRFRLGRILSDLRATIPHMEPLSVISLVEQAAGRALSARSGRRRERAKLYLAFQESALVALVELDYLRAFSSVYSHPVGSFWTWPHLLRSTDANKESLKRLLVAVSALETMRCPPATLLAARAFVEQMSAVSGALRVPRWWRPEQRRLAEMRWEEARSLAYTSHQDFQAAVLRDLSARRWLDRLPLVSRWA